MRQGPGIGRFMSIDSVLIHAQIPNQLALLA
jgi:hypothetical protein